MQKTRYTSNAEIDKAVLIYLENYKRVNEEPFARLALFGVKASDILKYLKNNQVAEKWGEEFTNKVWDAVERIYEKCILSFPAINSGSFGDILHAE